MNNKICCPECGANAQFKKMSVIFESGTSVYNGSSAGSSTSFGFKGKFRFGVSKRKYSGTKQSLFAAKCAPPKSLADFFTAILILDIILLFIGSPENAGMYFIIGIVLFFIRKRAVKDDKINKLEWERKWICCKCGYITIL